MFPSTNNIVMLSPNCQGVLSYMKEAGASVVCLQNTHATEREINSVKQICPAATYMVLEIIPVE